MAERAALYPSGLLQLAQRRGLVDRDQAKAWGRAFISAGATDHASIAATLSSAGLPQAAAVQSLLTPTARSFGEWQVIADLPAGPLGPSFLVCSPATLGVAKHLQGDAAAARAQANRELAISPKARHVLRPITAVKDVVISAYLPGRNLTERLQARGQASERRGLRLVRHLLKGLMRLHRAGTLHGDLRPGNVLLTTDHRAVFTHHGLAICADSWASGFTPYAAWLAPECTDGPGDERSEVYALACLLYQILSDREPFPGQRQALQHAKAARPDIRQVAPGITERTAKTIAKAMAINPADRYPNAEHLLKAIMACRDHLPQADPANPGDPRVATLAAASAAGAPLGELEDLDQLDLDDALIDSDDTLDFDSDPGFLDDHTVATHSPQAGPSAAPRTHATQVSPPGSDTEIDLALDDSDSFCINEPDD
ncbi:MAG: protein kinase [Planctomycetota bacterium]|nr:protein kinase [Planctomycetota bacterium]